MAKSKLTDSEQVEQLIAKLAEPLAESVQLIRNIFLSTDPEIGEQVKWNSPSFYYNGDMKPFDPKEYKRDIAVINLHRGRMLVVLPTGAKVADKAGLLEGNYADGRRVINFENLEDVKSKEQSLRSVIKEWLALVEK